MSHLGAVRRRGWKAACAVLLTISTTLLGAAALPASASATTGKAERAASHTAASPHRQFSAPVSGTTADGRSVTGTFTPQKFKVKHGKLVAMGMLRGHIEGKKQQFRRMVTMQVQDVQAGGAPSGGKLAGSAVGTCDILNLDLGPLDLNLLGLKVHLNEVVLDITAQSGPGQLLGNLLCDVAHLLDNNGPLGGLLQNVLTQLSDLLNQILGQLP
jgi:hypothetical protein